MRRIGILAITLVTSALAACGEQAERISPTGPNFSTAPAVSLSGPSMVQPNQSCEWYGQISGGVAPYTWAWSQSYGWGYVNERTTTLQSYVTHPSGTMTLSVTITDASGRTATAHKTISTSWAAAECQI